MVTRVRLPVCLSAAACPHYCTDPDVTWGVVGDAPSCALLGDLQSVRGLRCHGNIKRTRNVSEYMLVLALCLWYSLPGTAKSGLGVVEQKDQSPYRHARIRNGSLRCGCFLCLLKGYMPDAYRNCATSATEREQSILINSSRERCSSLLLTYRRCFFLLRDAFV